MAFLPPLRESASAVRTLIHERAKEPKPNWIGVRGLAGEALFRGKPFVEAPGLALRLGGGIVRLRVGRDVQLDAT